FCWGEQFKLCELHAGIIVLQVGKLNLVGAIGSRVAGDRNHASGSEALYGQGKLATLNERPIFLIAEAVIGRLDRVVGAINGIRGRIALLKVVRRCKLEPVDNCLSDLWGHDEARVLTTTIQVL